MTVARIYIIHAADGKSAMMQSGLEKLAAFVVQVDGSEGVEILRDLGNEHRFIFVEKWVSEEYHAKALAAVPPGTLDEVDAASDGPPDGAYYEYVGKTA